MMRWIILAGFMAAWFVPVAGAQQWVAYAPRERDFRVLMPSVPTRSITKERSVQYRADSGQLEFYVFRHDPQRLQDVQSVKEDVIKRITIGDEQVRGLPGDDGDFGPNEFILRGGGGRSMHHVFTERGRYYELMVRTTDGDANLDRDLIRDYFASFQMARGSAFGAVLAIPTPENCDVRSHALSRTVCQYVSCMQSANARHPVCTALPRSWHGTR